MAAASSSPMMPWAASMAPWASNDARMPSFADVDATNAAYQAVVEEAEEILEEAGAVARCRTP